MCYPCTAQCVIKLPQYKARRNSQQSQRLYKGLWSRGKISSWIYFVICLGIITWCFTEMHYCSNLKPNPHICSVFLKKKTEQRLCHWKCPRACSDPQFPRPPRAETNPGEADRDLNNQSEGDISLCQLRTHQGQVDRTGWLETTPDRSWWVLIIGYWLLTTSPWDSLLGNPDKLNYRREALSKNALGFGVFLRDL